MYAFCIKPATKSVYCSVRIVHNSNILGHCSVAFIGKQLRG